MASAVEVPLAGCQVCPVTLSAPPGLGTERNRQGRLYSEGWCHAQGYLDVVPDV